MDWSLLLIVAAVVAVFFTIKRMSFVSTKVAEQYLRQGALVIDVRSMEEFQGGHLPTAINIPLGQLRDGLPRHVPDRDQVILFHCLSGGRSAIARQHAKGLGYSNVFNLGSYRRAEAIVRRAQAKP